MSLATQFRPRGFEDVVGQEHVKTILQNQLADKDTKQAYLFTGPAGDGKTTTARILAYLINEKKGSPIEIDAASNNGVDNMRDIIESCKFKPLDTKFKIYIIDECHMLSKGAWNSFLKTLEEPPAHCVFILCTTDPQLIPPTILSRVQRFDFRRLTTAEIVGRLTYVCGEEKSHITKQAIEYIAKLANGGMRDALSLLEQCLSYTDELSLNDVITILGAADYDSYFDLTLSFYEKNTPKMIELIENLYSNGKNLATYVSSYADFLVEIEKYKYLKDFELIAIPDMYKAQIEEVISYGSTVPLLKSINEINAKFRYAKNIKALLEGELLCLI